MCSDPDYEFPDCTDEMQAMYMESAAFDAFNEQRREQVYHEAYHMEALTGSPF